MQTYYDLEQIQIDQPTYLTIGNFDGLHRGHQSLLQQMQQLALAAERPQALAPPPKTGLITFDPHPVAVLQPNHPHLLLTTPQERLAQASALGIDLGVIQRFTPQVAALDARQFMQLLKQRLQVAALVVGPDFALGRQRSGDLTTLRQLGEELGYRLFVIEPQNWHNKPVRSSLIRKALQHGNVSEAAELLGRNYQVTGEVVEGDRRGRQIGVPTANLQAPTNKLIPANGVYATRTHVVVGDQVQRYNSATNIGVRPTVDGLHQRIETHILDFPPESESGDLYGQTLQVEFVARLRGEERFASLDALVAQIRADLVQARQILQ
jgi:riboflavin kinase/FMN adenylyltransferase